MRKTEWLEKTRTIFGVRQPEKVAEYCCKKWPKETEHVIKTAKDACENTFLFDFTWDMERTWKPMCFGKDGTVDWSIIPWGDREFLWQFNRHRFLLCLGQAYQMTGEEAYAKHYVRLMADWINHAEPGENIDMGPWRTLESGIRMEMWLCSLPMIVGSTAADSVFFEKVECSLKKHQKRLLKHFQPHKYLSNWGVLEACGLFLVSLVLSDSEEALEEAQKRLEDTARIQVLEDGMQWEQSPMYHNEVYHSFLTAYYYGIRAGIKMPECLKSTIRKMAYVNYTWKKPDHTQFVQGDSDRSDLREQITAGAFVLQDGELKSGGYPMLDFENAWRFGWEGCLSYEKMQSREPHFLSAELPFGGNYYFRSGWTEEENLLHFHCGETGGGHGHADKLHVDLVINGEDVLVDSGRYTYVDGKERFQLKEAAGHNVVLVDGKGFAECETSWIYKNLCTCLKQQYFDGKSGSFVEGTHLGYWDCDVIVNRKIIWVKPDIYVLLDTFFSHGTHTYESLLHFDGHGSIQKEEQIVFTGDKVDVYIQSVDPEEEEWLERTEQSEYYNEKHPNQTWHGRSKADGFFRKITVINGGKKGKTAPVKVEKIALYSEVSQKFLKPEQAEGIRILTGNREFVLFLCHQEVLTPTDILSWQNCYGHGKAVLFDRTQEKKQTIMGEILAW